MILKRLEFLAFDSHDVQKMILELESRVFLYPNK